MQVLNRLGLAQVFVYSVAGPRDQRGKHCVAMVSSSALPASNTEDSCSLLAFGITPIVSGRAEDKQKDLYTGKKAGCESLHIYSISGSYGVCTTISLINYPMCDQNSWTLLYNMPSVHITCTNTECSTQKFIHHSHIKDIKAKSQGSTFLKSLFSFHGWITEHRVQDLKRVQCSEVI